MSDTDDNPTIVVNPVEVNGGQESYRVILCSGVDIFGTLGDHVAEAVAESKADIEEVVAQCEVELRGQRGAGEAEAR